MNQRTLKIGLLVNGPSIDPYAFDAVEWAARQPDMAVTHCIVLSPDASADSPGRWRKLAREMSRHGVFRTLARRFNGRAFEFLRSSEARSLRRSGLHAELFERRDLSTIVPEIIEVQPEVSSSGLVVRLNDDDLARLENEQFDVLLRFCDGILKGGILTCARHGVISFHHGNNRVNRGGPPGFWEVFERQPSTGFVIQRLTEELDGGDILFRGAVQTQNGWLLNQANLYTISYHYLRHVLRQLADHDALEPDEEALPYAWPLYRAPNARVVFRYLARKYRSSLVHRIERLRGFESRWGVAFLNGPWRSGVLRRGRVIEPPRGHFLADPFVIRRNGGDYVFVEDLDFATRRGNISVYQLEGKRAERVGVALDEDFHLSFPYLFEYAGALYMVPETSEARDVRLYRCTDFPLQWELVGRIFDDVIATDTMIFEKDGRWWLFTNENPAGAMDYSYQLSIWYADDPVSGTWQPHAANPVYVDALRARNGGLLRDGESLYRVNQQQGLGIYGRALSLNRIVELTPEKFSEERICDIEPEFFPRIFATHHMHCNGRYTAFDFCRRENPWRNGTLPAG